MASNKDTIYIDIDDEITGIIDKVRGSSSKVTALVLPKRAGVFQSIVNMKLLKRAADDAGKNLVLITSEAGLMPLAGAAGIHVAKTISSKPEIPVAPKMDDTGEEETIDETGGEAAAAAAGAGLAATAADEPVGKLADANDEVETVELDNSDTPGSDTGKAAGPKAAKGAGAGAAAADKAKKASKDKKKKIPDFNKFRLKLLAIGGIVLLFILAIILGVFVLPKATINIKTDASKVPVEMNLNLSTSATSLDPNTDTPTVPAKLASEQKTYSQQVPTTGQKNHGNKASGQVTVTNCSDDITLPAGTGFSSGGNTYISQQPVTVPASNFNPHSQCKNDGKASVSVLAQSGGTSANLPSGATFTISGGGSGLSAQGGTISGGTDNIVQTVNQNDIAKARSQISTSNDNNEKKHLQDQLKKDHYFAITSTFSAGTPNVTQSAQVGDVASSVTVTEVVTYTMFGAHEKDLDTLVDNAVKQQINTSKQSILSQGLDTAVFGVNSNSATSAQLTLQTNAQVGPDLNTNDIKQAALGKKPNDVKTQLQGNPDVTDVNVSLSPFWVSSVPKKASKVTVKIAEPTATKSNANASNP
jgi:hypothetical protein